MNCTRVSSGVRGAGATIARATAALALLICLISAPARAADPADTLGVYAGSGQPVGVQSFESRLGGPVHRAHEMLPKSTWSAMTDIGWSVERWRASAYAQRVVYSVAMLPEVGATLAQGASGAFNEHFRTLATTMIAAGEGSAVLRLGWEFNGSWYPWSIGVPGGPAAYAAYWRQIVTTMRSVAGADFKFDWTASNGSSWVNGIQLDPAGAWPGDAYVDYVGMDIYDQSWAPWRGDPVARWNQYVNQLYGLAWHRSFAAAHGKPVTFPEWGLGHRRDGNGGGDEPYFVEQMYEWIRTSNVAYHLYFEFADDNLNATLFDGSSPRAAARFVELFGPGSTGDQIVPNPPPPPPTPPGSPPAPAGSPSPPAPGSATAAESASSGPDAAVRVDYDRGDEGAAALGVPGEVAATKLSIARARIVRSGSRLDLLAPITRRATGHATVELHAGGRRSRFDAEIDSERGRLKIDRDISPDQARPGTGIITITYDGNARTRPQEVRLRAAAGKARLKARRPTVRDGVLRASGTISPAVRGVVRLQLVYDVDGRSVTRKFRAGIRNGRWRLSTRLSPAIREEIGRRSGSLHSYTLFTGYAPRRIGGEMKSYQVLGER